MNGRTRGWLCLTLVLSMAPVSSMAQTAPQQQPEPASQAADVSGLWLAAGGVFTTLRADCQNCEQDFNYRHGGGVLVDAGYRVNRRMNVGGEVFWSAVESASGHVRVTHLDAVAQFRPWQSKGFFLKVGAGMAFVRNWVDTEGPDAINSKALSIVIGGGWVFRLAERFGVEVSASQHAVALGDLLTSEGQIPDVMGNYWSLGMALVIR